MYQIWSKSVKPLPRYGDFSTLRHGGRRHLGVLKFQIFNGQAAQEAQTMSPSAILDLLRACLDHSRRAFGGIFSVQNFVGIGAVIGMFFDVASLA